MERLSTLYTAPHSVNACRRTIAQRRTLAARLAALASRAGAALVLGAAACAASAQSGTYPNGPVRLIVPFAPGGPIDIIGRFMAEGLTQVVGQSFVVDNRAGAAGAIGGQAAAIAAADGQVLFVGSSSTMSVLPLVTPGLKFDVERDFTPIQVVAIGTQVLVASPKLPVKTFPEFVTYVKAQPTQVTAASGGNQTSFYLAMAERAAGIKLLHVPYKGTGQFLTDVIAGHVSFSSADLSVVLPLIKSGQLRALGIASPKRHPLAPEIPTLAEQGYPINLGGWMGLFAPAKTPPAVRERLVQALNTMAADPKANARLQDLGLSPMWLSGNAAAEWIKNENVRYKAVIQDGGLKVAQ